MPRARNIVKAADRAKDAPVLFNPLHPLTVDIGSAVARRLAELGRLKRKPSEASKILNATTVPAIDNALALRVALIAGKVLEESLGAHTVEGRVLRMSLIAKLANEELRGAEEPPVVAQGAMQDEWLTTAQAAAKLETSRPYISMLCKTGKLGEVVMIDGRHRRIRASAVQAYLESRAKQHEDGMSPRQAGVDAGLYDYPDGHFANASREEEYAFTGAKKTARAKADRQSHR